MRSLPSFAFGRRPSRGMTSGQNPQRARRWSETVMDSKKFDDLAQRFSANTSRRRLLGGLVSGLLASLTGHTQTAIAEKLRLGDRCKPGSRKCPPNATCVKHKCRCLPGFTQCGKSKTKQAACFDLLNSPSHCGFCENTCLAVVDARCQGGSCCTIDGGACSAGCGPGALCGQCCSGTCRLDGTCGQITTCVPSGDACPSGCTPGEQCPGCCDQTCNLAGDCAVDGCVLYGGVCADSSQCCGDVPCTLGRCRRT